MVLFCHSHVITFNKYGVKYKLSRETTVGQCYLFIDCFPTNLRVMIHVNLFWPIICGSLMTVLEDDEKNNNCTPVRVQFMLLI